MLPHLSPMFVPSLVSSFFGIAVSNTLSEWALRVCERILQYMPPACYSADGTFSVSRLDGYRIIFKCIPLSNFSTRSCCNMGSYFTGGSETFYFWAYNINPCFAFYGISFE